MPTVDEQLEEMMRSRSHRPPKRDRQNSRETPRQDRHQSFKSDSRPRKSHPKQHNSHKSGQQTMARTKESLIDKTASDEQLEAEKMTLFGYFCFCSFLWIIHLFQDRLNLTKSRVFGILFAMPLVTMNNLHAVFTGEVIIANTIPVVRVGIQYLAFPGLIINAGGTAVYNFTNNNPGFGMYGEEGVDFETTKGDFIQWETPEN